MGEEHDNPYQVLCLSMIEYLVTLGLLKAVIDSYPPHVAEGLNERIANMIEILDTERGLIEGFGEAFDEESAD